MSVTPPPTPPTPPAEHPKGEVFKRPLFSVLRQLNVGEWLILGSLFVAAGGGGYKLYPFLNPPKPCPELGSPCPTSETINRDCQGLKDGGEMKVNAQRCLQLATDAQICGRPELALSLLDLSCENKNSEACREFNLLHQTSPCDPPPPKPHSSRQAPAPQPTAPEPVPTPTPAQTPVAPPRAGHHLDNAEKRKLTKELAKFKGMTIDDIPNGGDREALFYAIEIAKWLKEAGYPVKNGGDDLDTTTGGNFVGESVHLDHMKKDVWVEIGFQPPD